MTPAERYLQLPATYCDFLGGLHWSTQEDALEYEDGSTFVFTEEVALFLEGFASGGRFIHFAFVLHLLYLVRSHDNRFAPSNLRSSRAFSDAGRPLRNAGALCAILSSGVPEVSGLVALQDILDRLRDLIRPMRWFITVFQYAGASPGELPPWGPAAFEEEILKQLEGFTSEELQQWLRHGRGPVHEAGEALARELPLPRTLSGTLATLLERPRLAGARPFVTQLLSALALPPRQRLQPEIPLGGYADVTTHGQPHQLLPSQFALDEMDFLRRYADRELLYFRREDPHARTRHALVVLLDQGVRTWGDVRLVLGAAVLALGRQAAQSKLPFRVAATSGRGELIDPVEVDDTTLGELLETSDLSPHPGLALERLLERPGDGSRDVVLLTHPRNLQEEDVRAAALRATPETRLLALALDGRGNATLHELRHGVPIPLRQFRVDFNPSPPPPLPTERPGNWRGNVEPLGFPFRFGTRGPVGINLFDFDHDGRWLLTATRDGLLFAWKTDRSGQMEVLPRALVDGRLPGKVEAVVGVAGGFVVVAIHDKNQLAAVHYDFAQRTCTAHPLGNGSQDYRWLYSPEHHALLASVVGGALAFALDLGNGAGYPGERGEDLSRVRAAWYAANEGHIRRSKLICLNKSGGVDSSRPVCVLDGQRGELSLAGVVPSWEPFTPLADGQPVLKNCFLVMAECRGNVLGTVTDFNVARAPVMLRLFHRPGVPVAEYAVGHRGGSFTLSCDGKLLARQVAGCQVEVRDTVGSAAPILTTYAGGSSPQVQFLLGDAGLLLRSGRQNLHLLQWTADGLSHLRARGERFSSKGELSWKDPEVQRIVRLYISNANRNEPWVSGTHVDMPAVLRYDRQRFLLGAMTTVTAVLDHCGQLAILDAEQQVVCMFFVFRDQLSGWLPDGTCFGPASATGRPPTPDELEKFGRALTRAADWGRRTLCE